MERYPKPNVVVGGSILSCESSSLLGKKKLARWARASFVVCVCVRAFVMINLKNNLGHTPNVKGLNCPKGLK